MSALGSGGGTGSLGSPHESSIEQMKMTAAAEYAKQMMGIVKDSVDISFMQLGGNVWHYSSDTGHPVLHPMDTFRLDISEKEGPTAGLEEAFEDLVKQLPQSMQTRLLMDMQRPSARRNPALRALEEVLYGTARAIVTVNKAAEPVAAESAQAARQQINKQFLEKSVASAAAMSHELAESSFSLLAEEGANVPGFDQYMSAAQELENWGALLSGAKEGNYQGKEKLASKWGELQNSLSAYARLPKGAPLQILDASLRAMQPIAAAAMPNINAPSLLLSMWMATIGSSMEPVGYLNATLEQLSQEIAKPLAALFRANQGQEIFLKLLTEVSTAGAVGVGRLFAEEPVPAGVLPLDQPQYRLFSCELAMTMISSSKMFEAFFGQAVAALCAEEQASKLSSKALAQSAKMAMLLGMKKKGKSDSGGLLAFFQGQMEAMQELAELAEQRGALSGSQLQAFGRALAEAQLALAQGDSEPFMQAFSDLLDGLNGGYQGVEKGCEKIGDGAIGCRTLFSKRNKEESQFQTSLVQPA